jgi:dephospho-CoA kinase
VILFGLTGGLASGKSKVGQRFRARGVPVIDADQLAREVVAPGSEGLAAVAREFGDEVLLPDGSLDRKKVASVVFVDDAKRRALNAITHPRIGALTAARAAALAEAGEPLACYEAALLVENGIADAFRPLVVVAAPVTIQIARAMARDGDSEQEVHRRILSQMPLETKVAVADFVIRNTGTLAELEARADDVLRAICERSGIDPARYLS